MAIGTASETDTAGALGVERSKPEQSTTVQHPLLLGLWQELPDPAVSRLTPAKQAQWIETATVVLKLLYGTQEPPSSKGNDPASI